MLYLNSTASQATPERKRAQKFLLDNYNFRAYGESAEIVIRPLFFGLPMKLKELKHGKLT